MDMAMTEFGSLYDQVKLFATQHTPQQLWAQELPLAIIVLLAGIAISVLGAKVSRGALTVAFLVSGGLAGAEFGRLTQLHPVICGAVGGILIGTIGHLTFRLWAGLISAVVVSVLALGVFGYQRLLPQLPAFEQRAAVASAPSAGTFTVPTAEEQADYLRRDPRKWAGEFWSFATTQDVRLLSTTQAVGAAALLAGLVFGLLATRAALIIATSVVGTGLVVVAVGMMARQWAPSAYEAFLQRPQLTGVGIGGFLLTALVLQTLLTRRGATGPARPAPAV